MSRSFSSLTEQEILTLAIRLEDADSRIYGDFADALSENYPASAELFHQMRATELTHRDRLHALHTQLFGDELAPIQPSDVQGFVSRRPAWMIRPLGLDHVRRQAAEMEAYAQSFYTDAATRATNPAIRDLLTSLAKEEAQHEQQAHDLTEKHLTPEARLAESEASHRTFVLQVVQPGLAGLMDGSVSTLAPLFAAAFATRNHHHEAFLIGLAASVGAGISMGFAEALSDDGKLTGRGRPLVRGISCGVMTAIGGLGHTLPYLIPHFTTATTVAVIVVILELATISWIRNKYMNTPLLSATLQIFLGGLLVFLAGILIGNS